MHNVLRLVVLIGLAVACAAAQDTLAMPSVSGQDLYHGSKPLKRMGLVVKYQQVQADTAANRQFFITGQKPDSGAKVHAGDTVWLQFNCSGMLRYWQDWVVPLLGDFSNNVAYLKVTKSPQSISVPSAEYPQELVKYSFTGSVEVEVLVDFDGSPLAARVTRSSGHEEADSSACVAALQSSFSPGEHYGQPTRVWVPIPYQWQHVEDKERLQSKGVTPEDPEEIPTGLGKP
jgi:TonB family protein